MEKKDAPEMRRYTTWPVVVIAGGAAIMARGLLNLSTDSHGEQAQ